MTTRRDTNRWLDSLATRPVPARASAAEIVNELGAELPAGPTPANEVIDLLASACDPGLTAMPSGRFYGMVIGGTHPAALAADWLVSAWDQNAVLRAVSPAHAAVEDIASAWLLDVLGLPDGSGVGFVTGATMSNFTCLADALDQIPQGSPVILVLQAGNLHSGAFDPFAAAIEVAHSRGAWVHIDGAFGLFAAASATTRPLTAGYERADSWTTDAHKTLNVPYDCGIAIVADRAALRAAMTIGATDYLIQDDAGDPCETVPESSRRARAIPVWAVLRALGRDGLAALVDGYCRHATAFADGIAAIDGATVENDVVFSQVSASFGTDARTAEVTRRLMADGTAWMTGSRWRGKAVLRVSVSNWSTTADDVARSLAALRKAASE